MHVFLWDYICYIIDFRLNRKAIYHEDRMKMMDEEEIVFEKTDLYMKRSEIIKEYDLTPSSFDKWVKQARTTGSFKTIDNLTDEQRELMELRKRNKELEMQVDILKQAAVIMARKGK